MNWKSKLAQEEKSNVDKVEKNLVDYIVGFESGNIDADDLKCLFVVLINTKRVWSLQGFYGRVAVDLIQREMLEIRYDTQKYNDAISKLNTIQKLLIGLDLDASISKWQNSELSEAEIVYLISCLNRNDKKIWCNDYGAVSAILNGLRHGYFYVVPATKNQGGQP